MVHLFELPGEGCRRRLWYDKTNTPPDFDDEESGPMRRGRALEPLVAEEYTRETGRQLFRRKARMHPTIPWARVNVDREIQTGDRKGPGCLEIKTHGHHVFHHVKRAGLKQAHILQLQHAMWVRGTDWGAFAVLQPDSWELLHFDVERDDALIEQIKRQGDTFWPRVHSQHPLAPSQTSMIPDRPYSAAQPICRSCPWRQTCHGAEAAVLPGLSDDERKEPLEQDESLAELLTDYAGAKAAARDADATLELIETELKATLTQHQQTAVECSAGRVYFRGHERQSIDTKALRAKHPDVALAFTKTTVVRPLRVYTRSEPGRETDG